MSVFEKKQKYINVLKYLWIYWIVFVPVIIAIFGFLSITLSIILLIYCLIDSTIKLLKMTGTWRKSKHSIEKEEDSRLKEHYHCKLNPEGFKRLKRENFDREALQRNIHEFESLNASNNSKNIY